ncbi:hypothetical protein FOCC_FOCC015658 [Frankliniella occidentalis]|nr:hypothetical protein FOCC_FOCC015658 [Frankliniella occidentalis]
MTRIDSRAVELRNKLVPRVKAAIADNRCQASTDMWTDDQQKRHFIAITVTFIDEAREEPETYDLVVAKFPSNQKSTGVNIRNAMFNAMAEIGFSAVEFAALEWVTDKGSNIRKALEDLPREDCVAHLINTVVQRKLTVPYYEVWQKLLEAASPAATEVMETCEEAIKAVRAAANNLVVPGVNVEKLKKLLIVPQPQYHSKNSTMLKSISVNKTKVLAVLAVLGKHALVDRIRQDYNDDLAADIIHLLGPLEKTQDIAFGDLAAIMKHLKDSPEDSPDVAAMKAASSHLLPLMEILIVIKEAKELVTYLKASGLASNLSKKVLQEVETRWNSLHTMLHSVLDMYDEIRGVLTEQGQAHVARVEKVSRPVLVWLTKFLEEFKMETKTLEGDNGKHPTLPYVLLVSTGLRDHCEPALDDCPQLEIIKNRCHQFLCSKFQPSMKAKVATFLWPDYKELSMLSDEERDEVYEKVRSLIGIGSAGAVDGNPDDAPPPPKTRRLDDKYKKYRHGQTNSNLELQDEVTKYLNMATSVPAEQLFQIWKMMDRPDGLPKLAKLAMRELGKLATAAPSERVWSKAGFVLNNRRNRLTPAHLNSIIFLGSYLRNDTNKNVPP